MRLQKPYLVAFVVLSLVSLLLVQPAGAQTVPTVLPFGQIVQEYVNGAQMSNQYRFSALNNQTIYVMAASQDYQDSLNVIISDQLTLENVMMAKLGVSGMCLRIVPGNANYVLNVVAQNPQQAQWYGLMLMTGDPNDMACSEENFDLLASMATTADGSLLIDGGVDLTSTSCLAVSNSGTGVSIQTSSDGGSAITVGTEAPVAVVGSVDTGDLLLINDNGTTGLISGSAVTVGGDCSDVPVVTIVDDTISDTDSLIDLITGVVSTIDPSIVDIGLIEPVVDSAGNIIEPVVDSAGNIVYPVVDSAGNIIDPIVNGVTGSDTTGIIDPVVDTVNDVLNSTGTGGGTSGVVDPVVNTVNEVTGGDTGGVVDPVVDTVNDVLNSADTGGGTSGVVDPVVETVNEVTGGDTGGVVDPVVETVNDAVNNVTGSGGGGLPGLGLP